MQCFSISISEIYFWFPRRRIVTVTLKTGYLHFSLFSSSWFQLHALNDGGTVTAQSCAKSVFLRTVRKKYPHCSPACVSLWNWPSAFTCPTRTLWRSGRRMKYLSPLALHLYFSSKFTLKWSPPFALTSLSSQFNHLGTFDSRIWC